MVIFLIYLFLIRCVIRQEFHGQSMNGPELSALLSFAGDLKNFLPLDLQNYADALIALGIGPIHLPLMDGLSVKCV